MLRAVAHAFLRAPDAGDGAPGDPPERRKPSDAAPTADLRNEYSEIGPIAPKDGADARPSLPLESFPIPGFQLVREIGHGGFGRVYEAVSTGAVGQRVAIKVLLQMTPAAARAFEAERKILANLSHPNIARYIASGVLEDGRPWMALEYVEGLQLDKYCDREQLSTGERLKLFAKICAGVQHAHEFGIWHLDLKPQNILVTLEGEPKLLDFGIAKVSRSIDASVLSSQTRGFLTYRYSSPEQLRGEPLSSRSDVYNLGLILYELLTGSSVRNSAIQKAAEFIREALQAEPEPPSARAMKSLEISGGPFDTGVTGTTTAQGGPARLARRLRGDLDNIVLMALRREPTKRYESPAALAADIERHLDNLPVEARRTSVGYRFARQLQRYRVAIVATLIAAAGIAAVGSISVWQWREAEHQRMEAELRERELRSVLRFQEEQLANVSQADAGAAIFGQICQSYGSSLRAQGKSAAEVDADVARLQASLGVVNPVDVVSSLVKQVTLPASAFLVQREFARAEGLQAQLLMSLGRTAATLADRDTARKAFDLAGAINRRVRGAGSAEELESRLWLLRCSTETDVLNRVDEAKRILAEAEAKHPANAPIVLEARRARAQALLDSRENDAAIAEFEAIATASAALDPIGAELIVDLLALGEAYRINGKTKESIDALRKADYQLKTTPVSARLKADVLSGLGMALASHASTETEVDEALQKLRDAYRLDVETDGDASIRSLQSGANLAAQLAMSSNHADEARAHYAKLTAIFDGLPFVADEVLHIPNNYASWVFDRIDTGDSDAPSRDELNRQLERVKRTHRQFVARYGASHDESRLLERSVATKIMQLGDLKEAEALFRQLVNSMADVDLKDRRYFRVLDARADLALAVASQGRWREAIDMLRSAQEDGGRGILSEDSDARWNIACRLGSFLRQSPKGADRELEAEIAEQEAFIERLESARRASGKGFSRNNEKHLVPRRRASAGNSSSRAPLLDGVMAVSGITAAPMPRAQSARRKHRKDPRCPRQHAHVLISHWYRASSSSLPRRS